MSTKQNDEFLENAKERFDEFLASGNTSAARKVLEEVKERGFNTAGFVIGDTPLSTFEAQLYIINNGLK